MKIIETDNFGGDYPDEKFLNLPPMTTQHATVVAKAINNGFAGKDPNCRRYWRVVGNDYELQPGFVP